MCINVCRYRNMYIFFMIVFTSWKWSFSAKTCQRFNTIQTSEDFANTVYLFVYFIQLQSTWLNDTNSFYYKVSILVRTRLPLNITQNMLIPIPINYNFHFETNHPSQTSGCSFSYSFLHQIQYMFLCVIHPVFMSNHSEFFHLMTSTQL